MSVEAKDEDGARRVLLAHLAKALRRPAERIDPNTALPELGVDSAEMLFLVAALEDWSGLELPSDLPLEYRTVAALAQHVAVRLAGGR